MTYLEKKENARRLIAQFLETLDTMNVFGSGIFEDAILTLDEDAILTLECAFLNWHLPMRKGPQQECLRELKRQRKAGHPKAVAYDRQVKLEVERRWKET